MAASAAAPQIQKDFYRIGEVARMTDLKPFVLRYWETEFPMLEPVKSASGHRLYRAEDVNMVLRIKRLLYDEGFTIAGARRHLREPQPASDAHATTSTSPAQTTLTPTCTANSEASLAVNPVANAAATIAESSAARNIAVARVTPRIAETPRPRC